MNYTISRNYDKFVITIRKEGDFLVAITATIQPSGAVYCTLYRPHQVDLWAYWSTILSWGGFPIDKYSIHRLGDEILDAMEAEVEALRQRNTDWDAKYAPGADFTGNEYCN